MSDRTTCRWCHAGVPLHLVYRKKATVKALRTALNSARVASVQLQRGLSLTQPTGTTALMAALRRSASTLTALDGMPMRTGHELGLAAFTQLHSLTLRMTRWAPGFLRATDLPVSLRELTIDGVETLRDTRLPWLPALHGLQHLRRITFVNYEKWQLGTWDEAGEQRVALQLPPSLEVRCAVSVPVPARSGFPAALWSLDLESHVPP